MPFAIVPFLLLAIPVLEIAAFIVIGQHIGVFPTLAMILVTAIIGSILLRVQGFGLVTRIRKETDAGRVPGRELVHGAMIMVAGILLLTPGFITDSLGFLLFVPAFRDLVWRTIKGRVVVSSHTAQWSSQGRPKREDGVIDLDPDEYSSKPDPESPWNPKNDDQADRKR